MVSRRKSSVKLTSFKNALFEVLLLLFKKKKKTLQFNKNRREDHRFTQDRSFGKASIQNIAASCLPTQV
jgi:hypothetical protein